MKIALDLENSDLDIKQIDIGRELAIELYDTEFWETWTHEEIAWFQSYNTRLCMPFGVFHTAVEKTLNRPVWTHEFTFRFGFDQIRKDINLIFNYVKNVEEKRNKF